MNDGIQYNIDWKYQQSIIHNFKQSEKIRNNTTIIVNLNLNDKLYGNRWLDFYELNGLSKAAFGDSKRLVVSSTSLLKLALKYKDIPVYNFSNSLLGLKF